MFADKASTGEQVQFPPSRATPIDELPTELLMKILKEYVEDLRSKGGLRIPSTASIPATAIFDVCTLWKKNLMKMPHLFRDVEIMIELQPNRKRKGKAKRARIKKMMDLLAWRLEVVGECPVGMVLLSTDPGFDSNGEALPTNDMKKLKEVIEANVPNLKTLYEQFEVLGGCMYAVFQDMEPRKYKDLTHLRLQAPLAHDERDYGKQLMFPSLVSLSLDLYSMDPIIVLKAFTCSKLVSLVVFAKSESQKVNITEFANALRRFPVLEEIFPEIMITFDDNFTPYENKRMKHFVCTGVVDDPIQPIMFWLHFPNIQEVTLPYIELLGPYFAFAWPPAIVNITRINIHGSSTLHDVSDQLDFWQAIARRTPNLTRLTLSRLWSYDDLPRTKLFEWRYRDFEPDHAGLYPDHSAQLLGMLCEEDPKAFQGVRLPLYWPGLEHVGITGRINACGFASLHTMLKLRRYPNQNPISRGKGELKLTLIRCISCLLGGEVLQGTIPM